MSSKELHYEKYIFDNAKVGIAICNAKDHRLEMVNPAFAHIYGYEPHELIGASSYEIFTPECTAHLAKLENSPSNLVNDISFEATHIKKDGSSIYVSVHITILNNENGERIQRIVNVVDISTRKEQEEQLRKKEQEFRTLAENIDIPIYRYDKECRRVYINPAVEKLVGKPASSFLGQTPLSARMIHPSYDDVIMKSLRKVLATGKVDSIELCFVLPDNSQRYFIHNHIPEFASDGTVESVLAVGHDTTVKKELATKETMFRTLAENSPDTIARFNHECIRTYVNPSFTRIFGHSVEEVLGKPLSQTTPIPDHLSQAFENHLREVLATGKEFSMETPYIGADGKEGFGHVRIVPEFGTDGEITSVLSIGRDITELKQKEAEVLLKEEQFRTIMEHTPDPVIRYDKNCRRTYVNHAFTLITGKNIEASIGKTPTHNFNAPHVKAFEGRVLRVFHTGIEEEFEYLFPNIKNEAIPCLITLVPEKDSQGNIQSVLAIGRNIAKLKKFEHELTKQKDFQDTLLRSISEAGLGVHVFEEGHYIYTNNHRLAEEYGFEGNISAVKPSFLDAVHPDDKEKVAHMYQKRLAGQDVPITYTVKLLNKKSETREHEVSAVLIPNTNPIQTIILTKDITERRNIERRIEYMAHHDTLTGLPNRLLAKDRAEHVLAYAKRERSKVALLFIDLDGFKTVNDSLGHSTGDLLLKMVAKKLQGSIRASDTLSRQGGDEFLLILPNITSINEVNIVADKLLQEFKKPFHINNHVISTSASIGVSLYPEHADNFEQLLQNADTAMYQAKESGKNNYCFYTQQMQHNLVGLFQMQNDLKNAIDKKEFILHYQPQIDLTHHKTIGAEALIRWQHPTLGMIPPMSFIPIAESSGQIVQIGEWVLMEACRQAAQWNNQGKEIVVAVNISAVQFKRGNLEAVVKHALHVSGLNPKYLELELTESILINDTENILQTIKNIKALGIQLSIDDFGTGYSSLTYLKRFSVDKLKIDQSFIRGILNDQEDAKIVKTIIQMAKSFNLKSIAEGVENKDVLALLCEFGCDEVQGYHFAKPMSAVDFEKFMLPPIEYRHSS
jgi:diguanylate cyclase (GGDEF)-like protein/PAS domain S-box-containing protein